MRNGRILISGAGIAGPCLAYWLQRYGFEPVLIERAPALRSGGYVIDFWGLGFEVADKMGLVPALRRDGYQINEVRLVDARGRKAGGFSARAFQNVMGDRYLSILRSDSLTELGIMVRNYVTPLMSFALVAKLFMGRLLSDPLALPTYP